MKPKAIDPRLVMALLEYLDTRPHREVRQFIDALSNLPDIPEREEPKGEASDGLKVVK